MSVRFDDQPDQPRRPARGRPVPLRDDFQAADLTAADMDAITAYFERETVATLRHRMWTGRRRPVRQAIRKPKGGRK